MGYIEKHLLDNEVVKHKTKNHWIVFFQSILLFAFGSLLESLAPLAEEITIMGPVGELFEGITGATVMGLIGVGLKFLAFISFLFDLYKYVTSVYGVTDQRVIMKEGFFFLKTTEMLLNKVESFQVKQHLIGRILGYGDIFVSGTGGDDKQKFTKVSKPNVFKKRVQQLSQEHEARFLKVQQPARTDEQTTASVADEIKKLSDLMEKGAITQDEFDEQKRKILDR